MGAVNLSNRKIHPFEQKLNIKKKKKPLIWWFILCVSLTGLRDALMLAKMLFLGVSVRWSWEEISIWISRLSEVDHPHQCGWVGSQSLGHNRITRQRKGKFALCFWAVTSILSCPWTLELLVLRPLDLDWIISLAFLVLLLADSIWWDFFFFFF